MNAHVDPITGTDPSPAELHAPFEKALRAGHLIPILFVSAKTGAGLDLLKQALLAESKSGGRTSEPGKSGRGAPAKDAGKPSKPSKHRKGPPKSGTAPAAKSGGARKPKAKS